MDGNIEITKSNAYFFLDSLSDDMIFYTACNSQRILFGTLSNAPSAFSINSSLTSFHQSTNFHSNIGVYESNPKTSIHISRDLFIGSNDMNWPSDHGIGLYMRYSTNSIQNAAYIQSINRDGANSIIEYKNLNVEASNIYLSTGITSSVPRLSILANGYIGINTIAPNENLHVNGNILTQGNLILNSTQSIIYGSNYGIGLAGRIGYSLFTSNSLDIIGGANSSQTGRIITFYINSNIGNGSQGKAIFQGGNLIVNKGNIGIGQQNPLGQIHLGFSASNNIIIDATNDGFSSINFNGYLNTIINPTKNRWRLYTDQTGTNDILSIDVSDGTTSYNYLNFTNQNVGFNTPNPKARIHIVGTSLSYAGLDGTTGSNNPLTLEDNSGYAMRIVHLNTNATASTLYNYQTNKNVYWGESNDIGSYLFRGRNVCIGNSNADKKLCVGSGSTDITSAIKLNTGDSDKIYLTNSNNGSKISHSSDWSINIYAGQSNAYNGSITFATGSNSGYQERMIIDKSGYVGIGTHIPQCSLHVMGQTIVDGSSNISNSYIQIVGKSNQLTGLEILDTLNNGWIINKSNSDLLFMNSNGQMPLILNSNGNIYMTCNIGIGILNPESQVHISTTLQVGSQTLLATPNESTLSLRGNNQTVARQWNFMVGAASNLVSTYNTQRLRILDSNVERMTINPSGYIGIGTSNPANLLHLLSSTTATSLSTFETTASNVASYISFKSSNASTCYIGADGLNLLNISPGALTMATANNFNMLFATNNLERMRITSNGNVLFSNNIGINTLIPTERIHVTGNILSSSTITSGNYGKISGPIIELLGGTNASVYYQCYVESINQGIHLESKSASNTGLPFYINTSNRGDVITGGSLYPSIDNSNSSLGLVSNRWTSLYASNSYLTTVTTSNLIAIGSITSSNNCTLTSINATGVRLNFKRSDIADNWFIRGPDTTSYSHMMIGYNANATDSNVMRLDSGAIAGSPAKGLAIYGGITAYSNSTFPATLTASNLINQSYYSVTADVTGINYGLSNVLYGPGTVNGVFTFTPNVDLTYNIGNTAFTSFIPPVTGLWRVDATLAWPQTAGSYYGISLVKNHTNIFGSSTPGGTIVDWYKIGYGGASNTRPTSIYGKDLRYNLTGTVFLSTSDSLTTVLGYSGANMAGSNIKSYTDCKIIISLIQRSG
jgi:hypothetical protein